MEAAQKTRELLDPWDSQYAEKRGLRYWPAEELIRFLGRRASRGDIPSDAFILDAGCGNGANLWAMADMGFSVVGVDLSSKGLALAREVLDSRRLTGALIEASICETGLDSEIFDVVVDVVSSQHLTLSDHEVFYGEVARVLKPGGRFFSYHLGARTWDFGNGGGRLLDDYTLDNVTDKEAIFPNNGVVCMPPAQELTRRLTGAGFDVDPTEAVMKTYGPDKLVQYHVIEATRQ
jgi:SAM-dependent methyltransferase